VGDAGRLRQILTNLIGNAIKFTESGEVRVAVGLESRRGAEAVVRFTVSDTGIGIPAAQQEAIFKPFIQADGSTTRRYGGTGLGLAISTNLVALLGGRIWLESESGRGSSFHFTVCLPVLETAEAGSAEADAPGTGTRPLRILVADDNGVNQVLAARMLEKRGHAVVSVRDGRETLARLDADPRGFDVVLMDVQMSGMDGFEATAILREREHGTGRHLPIIAMTAHAMKGDRERCLAAGMDDYVSKPIRAEALFAALEAIDG
jgi:CheY-like chemotaxis protein